jgi:GT2 family glycosyltransferase
MINISIVICTYNRPKELTETLQGLQQQVYGLESTEVIVIDNSENGSAEDTVSRASNWIPSLLYKRETSIGLSYARNLGITVAGGEWVVFLDDDAVPDINWLLNLSESIELLPEPGVIGGAVLPNWSQPPPRWCTQDLYPALSLSSYQAPEKLRTLDFPEEYPVGANIAYPRQLLEELDGFKPEFGRRGNLLISGEETELNFRIQSTGHSIWFCPGAIVYHQIPPSRLKKSFFRSRLYWSGRTWALLHKEIYKGNKGYSQIVRHASYIMTVGLARSLQRSMLKQRNPFIFELYLYELIGYLVQAAQIVRQLGSDIHSLN